MGKTLLQNVKYIDETQIEATIPANLDAGIYHVEVINPEGQNAIAPDVIFVGESVFLPIIAR